MPYILPERRPIYDAEINALILKLAVTTEEHVEGDTNYCISRIVAGAFAPMGDWKYRFASRAHEVYKAAAAEFYRRVLGPLEDRAIKKNGDIPEYAVRVRHERIRGDE